jgi:hypothetical protein
MATAKPKSKEDLIAYYKNKLAELESPSNSPAFEAELNKHKDTLLAIYKGLKTALGKQRGVDEEILKAVSDAMGMKQMKIEKKKQVRKPK